MKKLWLMFWSVINNERGEVITPPVEPPTPPVETPPAVDPKQARNAVLKEMSSELGVNLFEADGLKQIKTLIDSQKTEQQKLQEQLESLQTKEAEWQTKVLDYEAKLQASNLGIAQENLEDALKLAGGDPTKLADVIKKYPIFKSKDGIKIGVQNPNDNTPPSGNSEVEAYMASNPRLYGKNKK